MAFDLDLPNKGDLILVVDASRGYHLSIATAKFQALPPQQLSEFVQVWHKGGRTFCTTERIISLDTRQELAYHEIVLMAGRVIEEILEEIRERQMTKPHTARDRNERIARTSNVFVVCVLFSRSQLACHRV